MNEAEFTKILHNYLDEKLANYEVSSKESLLYKVIVNQDGQFYPQNPKKPKRGNLAFQTDLLVKKKEGLPLVVCELKYKKEGGFTTHDVLTYSTKAVRHKEVYPYLRYGFIAGNTRTLTNKFFTHNAGFDFAMAMTKPEPVILEKFVEIVRNQIENAESLLNLLKDKNKTTVFNTRLELKNS